MTGMNRITVTDYVKLRGREDVVFIVELDGDRFLPGDEFASDDLTFTLRSVALENVPLNKKSVSIVVEIAAPCGKSLDDFKGKSFIKK